MNVNYINPIELTVEVSVEAEEYNFDYSVEVNKDGSIPIEGVMLANHNHPDPESSGDLFRETEEYARKVAVNYVIEKLEE